MDDENELARQFRIMTIPTLLVFKDGKVINRSAGVVSKEEIEDMVK